MIVKVTRLTARLVSLDGDDMCHEIEVELPDGTRKVVAVHEAVYSGLLNSKIDEYELPDTENTLSETHSATEKKHFEL